MEKTKFIVSGSISKDRIRVYKGKFSDVIKSHRLDSISVSLLTREGNESYGGTAANIAYTLALLAEEPVLLSSVGKEAIDYIEKLAAMGIDTSFVNFSFLPTADFTAIVDIDNNQIGSFYPGAMDDHESLVLNSWKNKDVLVVISPYTPPVMKRQVDQCKEFDLKYVYDPGQQIMYIPPDELHEAVKGAEIVFVNEYESLFIAERLGVKVEELKSLTSIIVITKGDKGCTLSGAVLNDEIHVPSVRTPNVVDPTGAGDAFRAGFLWGYIFNFSLEKCARIGSLSATYAISMLGAQSHFFNSIEFKEAYKNTFNEDLF